MLAKDLEPILFLQSCFFCFVFVYFSVNSSPRFTFSEKKILFSFTLSALLSKLNDHYSSKCRNNNLYDFLKQ